MHEPTPDTNSGCVVGEWKRGGADEWRADTSFPPFVLSSIPKARKRISYDRLLLACLVTLLLFAVPRLSTAQPFTQSWGPGGQVGDPSGLTVKYYPNDLMAYEVVLSYDLDENFALLNGRYLFEQPIPESPLHFFLGPGVTLANENGSLAVGTSGTLGLNFYRERFEVFLHFTPRLNVLPDTNGHLGGGVGLHYYLP